MQAGFIPISIEAYVAEYVRHNPGVDRDDLAARLRYAAEESARGARCRCGNEIWIVGSAELGQSCFSCITGEAFPDSDYEIDLTSIGDRRTSSVE